MNVKIRHILLWSAIAILIAMVTACGPDWKDEMMPGATPGTTGTESEREIQPYTRKVMILYSAGFNSLSRYLKEDIDDLCEGWLPRERKSDDVILVYSHQPAKHGQYSEMTQPVLFRIYSQADGTAVRDTLTRVSSARGCPEASLPVQFSLAYWMVFSQAPRPAL